MGGALQVVDRRIADALNCPCLDDLKSGPCAELFINTFTCFHKSRAEPKGCDCVDFSLAFAVGQRWEDMLLALPAFECRATWHVA